MTALYRATDGGNWTNNDGWLSDQLPGTWHGVSADENGNGTILNLRSNELTGELPSELGSLASLRGLHLQNNDLVGEIPPKLGQLTNLSWLNLSGNRLTGGIPQGLLNLTQLTRLYLSGNLLGYPTGFEYASRYWPLELPANLDNLMNLKVLNLASNDFGGEIPTELANLANLGVLNLSGNLLNKEIPAEFGYFESLTNLTHLDLSDNFLSGNIPSQLGNRHTLKQLDLSGNRLSGGIPWQLGDLHRLERLNLSDNQLSGAIPLELVVGPDNMRNLDLSHNRLTGRLSPSIGDLTYLQVLDLSNNQLSGEVPKELGQLVNLKQMYIHTNPSLSGCVPGYLEGVRGLEIALNDHQGNLDGFCLSSGAASDKSVLETLYDQTDGDGWLNRSDWMTKKPMGDWYGVETENGRVIKLDLGGNNLVGRLPWGLKKTSPNCSR